VPISGCHAACEGVSGISGQHTGSSYDGTKCKERRYERSIVQANPETLLQKPGIHKSGENLAKQLSTRSLISLHQSIRYEGGGNLLSTKPTSV